MQLDLDQVISHLQKVRAQHGDEHYHAALKGLFRDLILKEGGAQYITKLLEKLGETSLDVDSLRQELLEPMLASVRAAGINVDDLEVPKDVAPSKASQPATVSARIIEQTIQQGMPNCKTKAHFDLVMQASETLRVYLDAAFGFDMVTANKARVGLLQLLDLAPQVASVAQKLEEHPEATTNKDYVEPPAYLSEGPAQQALLGELANINDRAVLDHWYVASKARLDGIVSQRLRDELFDAIRAKKHALSN